MTRVDDFTVEMTEEEESAFNAAVADPATISSETQATEVLECLDSDIDQIRAQLNAVKIEADTLGTLPEARQHWVRRASGALVWKLKQRGAVGKRLTELRPPVEVPPPPPKAVKQVAEISAKAERVASKVEVAKLKLEEQRLIRDRQAEAQIARERTIALSNEREREHSRMFVNAARDTLPREDYLKIWARAREMFPDHPAWDGDEPTKGKPAK